LGKILAAIKFALPLNRTVVLDGLFKRVSPVRMVAHSMTHSKLKRIISNHTVSEASKADIALTLSLVCINISKDALSDLL
jgi:hypothetical protein